MFELIEETPKQCPKIPFRIVEKMVINAGSQMLQISMNKNYGLSEEESEEVQAVYNELFAICQRIEKLRK